MEMTFTIEKKGDRDKVNFVGDINEDAEVHLNGIVGSLGSKVTFNLRGVTSVNSCGVRAWINFMREAEKNRDIIFEECTPEIVSQINMIPNFKGSAHIKSVYAGYACDSCENQQWKLFEEGRNLPTTADAGIEELKCPKCGEIMEMDEIEDEFFGWLDVS
jgi:anti-anti-sigma regulatory factor